MVETAEMTPLDLPLSCQYRYTMGWNSPKAIVKYSLAPIYRKVFRKGAYMLLRKKK